MHSAANLKGFYLFHISLSNNENCRFLTAFVPEIIEKHRGTLYFHVDNNIIPTQFCHFFSNNNVRVRIKRRMLIVKNHVPYIFNIYLYRLKINFL